jgi:hypothetical protein
MQAAFGACFLQHVPFFWHDCFFCHQDDDEMRGLNSGTEKKKQGKRKQLAIKGPWSKEEDDVVVRLVKQYGPKRWSLIASNLPGKSPSYQCHHDTSRTHHDLNFHATLSQPQACRCFRLHMVVVHNLRGHHGKFLKVCTPSIQHTCRDESRNFYGCFLQRHLVLRGATQALLCITVQYSNHQCSFPSWLFFGR